MKKTGFRTRPPLKRTKRNTLRNRRRVNGVVKNTRGSISNFSKLAAKRELPSSSAGRTAASQNRSFTPDLFSDVDSIKKSHCCLKRKIRKNVLHALDIAGKISVKFAQWTSCSRSGC